jgi:hypothetical protein
MQPATHKEQCREEPILNHEDSKTQGTKPMLSGSLGYAIIFAIYR